MIVVSEEQRQIILLALTRLPVQVTYERMEEAIGKMRATVEAVKAAAISEAVKE